MDHVRVSPKVNVKEETYLTTVMSMLNMNKIGY